MKTIAEKFPKGARVRSTGSTGRTGTVRDISAAGFFVMVRWDEGDETGIGPEHLELLPADPAIATRTESQSARPLHDARVEEMLAKLIDAALIQARLGGAPMGPNGREPYDTACADTSCIALAYQRLIAPPDPHAALREDLAAATHVLDQVGYEALSGRLSAAVAALLEPKA